MGLRLRGGSLWGDYDRRRQRKRGLCQEEAAYEGPGVVQATSDQSRPCLVICCWPTDGLDALQMGKTVVRSMWLAWKSVQERE